MQPEQISKTNPYKTPDDVAMEQYAQLTADNQKKVNRFVAHLKAMQCIRAS